MVSKKDKNAARKRRHARVRAKISVYRSNRHISAQVIDDVNGVTLASASTQEKSFEGIGSNKAAAKVVGETVAKRALDKGIENVVFDRGGYLYHGRVSELAAGAREAGLKF